MNYKEQELHKSERTLHGELLRVRVLPEYFGILWLRSSSPSYTTFTLVTLSEFLKFIPGITLVEQTNIPAS